MNLFVFFLLSMLNICYAETTIDTGISYPHCDGTLAEMNLDCQLLILERLNLSALLNVAQTNSYFTHLATNIYRRTYSNRAISIRSPEFSPGLEDIHIAKHCDYIIVTNLEIAAQMLNVFGHAITKVGLKCTDMTPADIEKITKVLNDFSTESLVQIEFDDCTDGIWNNFSPFKNIERVTLSGNVKTGNISLNKLFPNLHELLLKDVEIYDRSAFRQTFPHLTHLLIVVLEIEGFVEADVEEMIMKNPQLTSLSLEYASMRLLQFVNKHLPSLESIEIAKNWLDSSINGEIHFDRVKYVSLNFNHEQVLGRLFFPQLIELKLECFPELSDTWIDYIKRNKHVSKLIITPQILGTQITALVDEMPSLTEVFFACAPNVDSETIIDFIKSNTKVNKIQLKTFNKLLGNELKSKMGLGWKVKDKCFGVEMERFLRN